MLQLYSQRTQIKIKMRSDQVQILAFQQLFLSQIKLIKTIYQRSMQLLDYEQVTLHQMELLGLQGASLSYFAETNKKQDLFIMSNMHKLPNLSSYDVSNVITLKDHIDSNLMALSIAFLKSIFQKNNHSLLQHIKCSLYSKDLSFYKIPLHKRFKLSDKETKKIFVEFFQLLTYVDEDNKVIQNLEKYSIILTLFVIYFRVILYSLNMTQALNTLQSLQTKKIYLILLDFFDISYREINGIYLFLDDNVFMSIVNSQYHVGNYIEKKRNKSSVFYENLLMVDANTFYGKKIRRQSKDINEENDEDFDPQIASLQSSTPSFVRINPQDQNFAKKEIHQTSETNHNQQYFDNQTANSFAKGQFNYKLQQKVSLSNIGVKQVQQFQITTTITQRKKSDSHFQRLQTFNYDSRKNQFSTPQQCSTPNSNNSKLEASVTYSQFSKNKQNQQKANSKIRKQNRAKFLQNLSKEIKNAQTKLKYSFPKKSQIIQQATFKRDHQKKWSPVNYNRSKKGKTSNIHQPPNPFQKHENFPSSSRIPNFIAQKKKTVEQALSIKPMEYNMDQLNSFYSTQSYLIGQTPSLTSKVSHGFSDEHNLSSLKSSNEPNPPKRLVKTSAIYFRDTHTNFGLNEYNLSSKARASPPKITFTYNKKYDLLSTQRSKNGFFKHQNL